MDIKEGRGKLYLIGGSEQFISDIDCKLYQDLAVEPPRWWGECYIDRGVQISEKEGYIIELGDGCKGRCFVRKLVNRVLPGIPARNIYRIIGTGLLK